jgi:predicted DNA-binding transcriptional regulator AlpA
MRRVAESQEQGSPDRLDLLSCATVSLPVAAQILGIHRSTAWDLHKRGEFPVPVLQIGSRLRVTKANLDAFLASGGSTPKFEGLQ